MNCETRRKAIGLNIHTLAQEAGVVSSSVCRLEAGGNSLLSTRRKILEALKRLEAEHKEIGYANVKKTVVNQGRRRPDIARARKTLGLTQSKLAEQWKTTKHEISKIESGYDTPDHVLEEMIDGQLRAMMNERGLEWPRLLTQREIDQLYFKSIDTGSEHEKLLAKEKNPREAKRNHERPLQVNTRIEPGITTPCPACHDTRVVWNPQTGSPFKCPLCEGRTS